jgi:hypothetical protein
MRQWALSAVYNAIFAIIAVRLVCWLLGHFCEFYVDHPWDMIAFAVLFLVMVIPDTIHFYKHGPKSRGNSGNNDLFPGM